jgi:hypothetical protein
VPGSLDDDDNAAMQINGSLPMHVARAYGVSVTRPVATAQVSTAAAAPQPVERAAPTEPLARIERTAVPGKVNQLIAGAVPGAVTFDGSFTPIPGEAPTLKLYTRAADTIEAATGIQLGRAIDLKG